MTNITQKQLDDFKSLHPGNPQIQALTLDEVLQNARGKTVDWNSIQFDEATTSAAAATAEIQVTDCQMAIGWVIFDAFVLAFGAVTLRRAVNARTIQAVARAAAPMLSKIELTVAKMGAQGASKTDLAWGVFEILKTIFSGGSLGAVFSAITASLTWWDMIIYGIAGTATIIAALATDGLAFAAEVVILLTSFGFLASDSVKAFQTCNLSPNLTDPVRPVEVQPSPTPNRDFIANQVIPNMFNWSRDLVAAAFVGCVEAQCYVTPNFASFESPTTPGFSRGGLWEFTRVEPSELPPEMEEHNGVRITRNFGPGPTYWRLNYDPPVYTPPPSNDE
jgi:hypothetical protein